MSAISPSPLRRVQSEGSIAAMFELQAALYPKRPAIGTSAGVLHYDQLNAAANRQARALRALAAPADVPVALLMEQGSAFITAMLAVLKAGHFFVPLDPTVPPDRNAEILRDSGARWVISDAAHLERAAAIAARPCEAINLDAQAAHLRGHNLRRSPMDPDLAYLLYTSGSTGKPKAAIQDQRSVIHNMRRHVRAFAITPADRISLLYGCSVYGAMRDVFNALLNGASIHTYPVRQLGVGPLAHRRAHNHICIRRHGIPSIRGRYRCEGRLSGPARHQIGRGSGVQQRRGHFPKALRGSLHSALRSRFHRDRNGV